MVYVGEEMTDHGSDSDRPGGFGEVVAPQPHARAPDESSIDFKDGDRGKRERERERERKSKRKREQKQQKQR